MAPRKWKNSEGEWQVTDAPISPAMCRAGRGALAWRVVDLAEEAQLGRGTIIGFEGGRETKLSTVSAIRNAFEKHGVLFGTDQQGRAIVAFIRTESRLMPGAFPRRVSMCHADRRRIMRPIRMRN